MAANTRRISRNESTRKIPVDLTADDWRGMDAVMGASEKRGPIVDDRGRTLRELMARYGLQRSAMKDRIRAALASGRLRHIGYRSGTCGEKVYEVVGRE